MVRKLVFTDRCLLEFELQSAFRTHDAMLGPRGDRTLPVEILALIFLEGTYFDHGNDFLITASHVSRYWRNTALSTPCLWWDVVVSTTWTPRINYERAMSWLGRSRHCPVRIRSLLRGEWPQRPCDALTPDEVTNVIDILSSNVSRIRSFIMDNRGISISAQTILRALRQTSDAVKALGAPLLRDLSVYGSAPMLREPTRIIGWPAVDLGFFPSLENLLLRYAALIELPPNPKLSRKLTRFSYKRYTMLDRDADRFTGTRRMSVADILETIDNCTALTHLDISDIANGVEVPAFATSKRVVSQNLKNVELSFRSAAAMVHFLRRISLPNVVHLSLDADFEAPADDARPVFIDAQLVNPPLNSLTSLQLSSVCPPVISSILRRSPNLERLWIDGIDDWPFNMPGTPIETVVDVLVSPQDDNSFGWIDSTGVASTVPARDTRNGLLCPRIKSFCIVDCDDLHTRQVIRLANAYVHQSGDSRSRPIEVLRVGLRDEPTKMELEQLRESAHHLDISATKWPESDFDSGGFDYTLIPF